MVADGGEGNSEDDGWSSGDENENFRAFQRENDALRAQIADLQQKGGVTPSIVHQCLLWHFKPT
jgi:hypothetical protein